MSPGPSRRETAKKIEREREREREREERVGGGDVKRERGRNS